MPDTAFLHPSPTRAGISCQQIFLSVKYRRYRSVGTEGSSVGKAPSPPLSRRYGHQTIDTYKARKNILQKNNSRRHCSQTEKGSLNESGQAQVYARERPKDKTSLFVYALYKKKHTQKCSPRFSRLNPLDIPRYFRAACVSYTPNCRITYPTKKAPVFAAINNTAGGWSSIVTFSGHLMKSMNSALVTSTDLLRKQWSSHRP